MAFVRSVLRDVLDLWAPPRCTACNAPYPAYPPTVAVLCALCVQGLEPASELSTDVFAPFAYGGPLARAILYAKGAESPAPARALGALLAHQLALAEKIPAADLVVPVPLHRQRLIARGFNQAVEMARALGLPLALGAVRRARDTPSQRGLKRNERLTNVRNAFVPARPDSLAGLRVLILDDVVTTGATLSEVASAVRTAGAVRITCIALARAVLEGEAVNPAEQAVTVMLKGHG